MHVVLAQCAPDSDVNCSSHGMLWLKIETKEKYFHGSGAASMATLEQNAADLLRHSAKFYREQQRMHGEQINSVIEKVMLRFGGGGGDGLHRGDLRERQFREISCVQGEENQWKELSLKFTATVKEASPEIYDGLKWAESEADEVTLDDVKNKFGDQRVMHSTMIFHRLITILSR